MIRFLGLVAALFMFFIELIDILHHVIKIRMGDVAEGWSIRFVVWLIVSSVLIAAALAISEQRLEGRR